MHSARETENKFYMVIKLDVAKIFTASTTFLPWPKFLVTRMLTRDLFAVADHLVTFVQ